MFKPVPFPDINLRSSTGGGRYETPGEGLPVAEFIHSGWAPVNFLKHACTSCH